MHDCSPVPRKSPAGLFASAFHRDRMNAVDLLPFLYVPSSLFLSVPLNFAVCLLFHFKRKCAEGPSLDFCIDHQWINRRFKLLLVGKSSSCNPSPAINSLLLQRCIFLFLLLCFCCSTLHLTGCCELVSGVCWATRRMEVQWHIVYES